MHRDKAPLSTRPWPKELTGPCALLQFKPELPMVQIQERPGCLRKAGTNQVVPDVRALAGALAISEKQDRAILYVRTGCGREN